VIKRERRREGEKRKKEGEDKDRVDGKGISSQILEPGLHPVFMVMLTD